METMKTIAMRKSTRSYEPEQISDNSLNQILNAGYSAPVGVGDYGSIYLTVIQNAAFLDKITKATTKLFGNIKVKPFYGAPTVIIVSGKPTKRFPHIELADAACIIENMALAATDLGLGSVYLLGFLNVFSSDNSLLKELNLPEGFAPVSAIAIGHPTEPITEERKFKQTIKVNFLK